MPQLIAMKSFRYARHQINAGESFDAAVADVRVLLVTGYAKHAPEKVTDIAETAAEPLRRYKRRDMRAQA
jgi:hypothetical protein